MSLLPFVKSPIRLNIDERKRLIETQFTLLCMIALSIPYPPLFYLLDLPIHAGLALLTISTYHVSFALSYFHYFRTSKIFFITILDIMILIFSYTLGKATNLHLCFITASVLPFPLFKVSEERLKIAMSGMSFFGLLLLELLFGHWPYSSQLSSWQERSISTLITATVLAEVVIFTWHLDKSKFLTNLRPAVIV